MGGLASFRSANTKSTAVTTQHSCRGKTQAVARRKPMRLEDRTFRNEQKRFFLEKCLCTFIRVYIDSCIYIYTGSYRFNQNHIAETCQMSTEVLYLSVTAKANGVEHRRRHHPRQEEQRYC